jgi:hypothetical protein
MGPNFVVHVNKALQITSRFHLTGSKQGGPEISKESVQFPSSLSKSPPCTLTIIPVPQPPPMPGKNQQKIGHRMHVSEFAIYIPILLTLSDRKFCTYVLYPRGNFYELLHPDIKTWIKHVVTDRTIHEMILNFSTLSK